MINATFKDQVFFRSRSLFNIKVHFLDFGLTIYFLRDNHSHFFTKNQDKGNHYTTLTPTLLLSNPSITKYITILLKGYRVYKGVVVRVFFILDTTKRLEVESESAAASLTLSALNSLTASVNCHGILVRRLFV